MPCVPGLPESRPVRIPYPRNKRPAAHPGAVPDRRAGSAVSASDGCSARCGCLRSTGNRVRLRSGAAAAALPSRRGVSGDRRLLAWTLTWTKAALTTLAGVLTVLAGFFLGAGVSGLASGASDVGADGASGDNLTVTRVVRLTGGGERTVVRTVRVVTRVTEPSGLGTTVVADRNDARAPRSGSRFRDRRERSSRPAEE